MGDSLICVYLVASGMEPGRAGDSLICVYLFASNNRPKGA